MAVSGAKGTQRWIWLRERAKNPFFSPELFSHMPPTPCLTPFCSSLTLICSTQLHSCCTHRIAVCGGQKERRAPRQRTFTPCTRALQHTLIWTTNRKRRGVLLLIPLPQRTTRQSPPVLFCMTEGGWEWLFLETAEVYNVIHIHPWLIRLWFDSSSMKSKGCQKMDACNSKQWPS